MFAGLLRRQDVQSCLLYLSPGILRLPELILLYESYCTIAAISSGIRGQIASFLNIHGRGPVEPAGVKEVLGLCKPSGRDLTRRRQLILDDPWFQQDFCFSPSFVALEQGSRSYSFFVYEFSCCLFNVFLLIFDLLLAFSTPQPLLFLCFLCCLFTVICPRHVQFPPSQLYCHFVALGALCLPRVALLSRLPPFLLSLPVSLLYGVSFVMSPSLVLYYNYNLMIGNH